MASLYFGDEVLKIGTGSGVMAEAAGSPSPMTEARYKGCDDSASSVAERTAWRNALFLAVIVTAVFTTNLPAQLGTSQPLTEPIPALHTPKGERGLLELHRNLPMQFERNLGQTSPEVNFVLRGSGSTLFLTSAGAVLRLEPARQPSTRLDVAWSGTASASTTKPSVLDMSWVDANREATAEGLDELPGKSNYFVGNDPKMWRTSVPAYAKVKYRDLYPGVDLVYYGDKGRLEFDLIVAPGALPEAIRLKLTGARRLKIDRRGDLVFWLSHREARLHKPTVYQLAGTTRQGIEGRYALTRDNEIRFQVGAYDRSRPLVIDPQLMYSSYLGGSESDAGQKVALDSQGNTYVVGYTSSLNFPIVSPLQATNNGSTNVFVSKINPTAAGASSLVYSTYLGGTGNSIGRGIAIGSLGEIIIAGDTDSSNFPVTTGAYQIACKLQGAVCSSDAFVTKLNSAGNQILYSTYLGGSGSEFGFGVTTNSTGHIFVTGPTGSSDFPVTLGAAQTVFAGGGATFGDAFVAELNPAGTGNSDLVYSTYLGGAGSEEPWAIAVDPSGALYVAGRTTSSNFPVTSGAYQNAYGGAGSLGVGDAFVTKLNPAGQGPADLVYSTYLGGSNDEQAESIALDVSNRIYVTGFTVSIGFPVTAATAYQSTFGGGVCNGAPCADAFIAILNPSNSGTASLVYSTFFGGASFDLGHAIAIDQTGLVYIAGETASTNFPLVSPIQSTCYGGCTPLPMDDAFLAKFDFSKPGTSALLFSTYLGGNDVDTPWGLAVDTSANMYITGQTFSTNFPTLIPFQAMCNGCSPFAGSTPSGDAFLVKVCTTNCAAVSVSPPSLSFANQFVGTTSTAQSISVMNSGSGTLTIAGIAIVGTDSGDFAQTNNCGSTLAPQASCSINVTFTPIATGLRSVSVSISDNGPGNPQSVTVSGTGMGPTVSLSASSLSFSNQTTNTTSASQNITLTNSGPGALTISTIGVTGANAGDFAQTNTCPVNPATLVVNANCTITVTFTPTATGSRVASVSITDNGNTGPQAVSLSGTGVIPLVTLSVSSLSFGNQTINTTSASQIFTLTNSGPGALTISTIAVTGTNAGDFGQINTCPVSPATLAVNANCTLTVTFTPTATGSRVARISITDNGVGSPQSISLSGTGVVPVVTLSAPSLSFGNQTTNTTSTSQNVTVTNSGPGVLTISTIAVTGTNAGDFAQTNTCPVSPATLAVNANCTITVKFTPTATGSRVASITITDNGGSSPQSINLSGTGVVPVVTLSASSLSFGNQTKNTTSASQNVTLTNSGPGLLTISTIALTGTNAGDFGQTNTCPVSPATLAVNANCTLTVKFTPTATGSRVASFTITDNGGGSPQSISLSGTGVVPVVTLSGSSLSFGNQTKNTTSASQNVTLTNSGPGLLTISTIAMTGTNAGDFAQTNTCPVSPGTLAVNANCTLTVKFTPTATGSRGASISITDNGSGSPQSISLSGTGANSGGAPWPNGYTFQATFTVAAGKVPSAQANFPALISGTFPDFKTVANGGQIANLCTQTVGTNAISVPCDLVFTSDIGGTVLLNWEFESYNATTGAVNIWVNVPTIGNGTVVYAWYGKSSVSSLQTTPTATWSSSFEAVYHLEENPSGAAPQMNDSTLNANQGTTQGGMPAGQQAPGQIGGSLNFNGGNYYVTLANASNFSFERTDSFSASCWVKPAANAWMGLLSKETSAVPIAGWMLMQGAGTLNPVFALDVASNWNNRAQARTSAEFSVGAWHHVVATYS
ncbi:MAG TPA: choice-of-anchor D domain-containing protein, partial [Bryobacteraceae bacterium]|nr:choice-of-anchor D domain-containing protein [Bryobacteraceae bacterium]